MPITAPAGFLKEAISENLIAGPAMRRRAMYHVGDPLVLSAEETVGSGLGAGLANGTHTMAPPNLLISQTGEELIIDGVRMVFQITSGTEAPAEFNVGFPDIGVANIAENANPTQHNILTPRGAQVRDAKQWADDLSEAIDFFGYADVLVVSHGWPRFGKDEIREYLSKQRDAYKFLHDQTVRLMNKGYTPREIAANLKLPEALSREWYNRPHYGEFSFNARAVYQRYLGWFDGNPVHFRELPPEEAGRKYVAAMGGSTSVLQQSDEAYAAGDYVWASELLNHLVFSGEAPEAAKARLADTYEQLGWQAENALWRNFYLSAAKELRDGVKPLPGGLSSQALTVLGAVPTEELFDILATQLDPEKAGKSELHLGFVFPDRGKEIYVSIANGVLTHRPHRAPEKLDGKITVNRMDFLLASAGNGGLAGKILSGEVKLEGNPNAFRRACTMPITAMARTGRCTRISVFAFLSSTGCSVRCTCQRENRPDTAFRVSSPIGQKKPSIL